MGLAGSRRPLAGGSLTHPKSYEIANRDGDEHDCADQAEVVPALRELIGHTRKTVLWRGDEQEQEERQRPRGQEHAEQEGAPAQTRFGCKGQAERGAKRLQAVWSAEGRGLRSRRGPCCSVFPRRLARGLLTEERRRLNLCHSRNSGRFRDAESCRCRGASMSRVAPRSCRPVRRRLGGVPALFRTRTRIRRWRVRRRRGARLRRWRQRKLWLRYGRLRRGIEGGGDRQGILHAARGRALTSEELLSRLRDVGHLHARGLRCPHVHVHRDGERRLSCRRRCEDAQSQNGQNRGARSERTRPHWSDPGLAEILGGLHRPCGVSIGHRRQSAPPSRDRCIFVRSGPGCKPAG